MKTKKHPTWQLYELMERGLKETASLPQAQRTEIMSQTMKEWLRVTPLSPQEFDEVRRMFQMQALMSNLMLKRAEELGATPDQIMRDVITKEEGARIVTIVKKVMTHQYRSDSKH